MNPQKFNYDNPPESGVYWIYGRKPVIHSEEKPPKVGEERFVSLVHITEDYNICRIFSHDDVFGDYDDSYVIEHYIKYQPPSINQFELMKRLSCAEK